MTKILCAIVLLCSTASAGLPEEIVTHEKLVKIQRSFKSGKVAIYASFHPKPDYHSPQFRIGVDENVPVPTASTIKLLILAEAMHEIMERKKSLDDEITLQKDDQVLGSGVLPFFRTPLKLKFEDVLAMMIIQSDNTATNLAIDHLGRDNINKRGELMGLKNTYLYKKVYRKPDGPMPPDQKKFGLGKTTAAEMARVMESIVECEVKDETLCEKVKAMLRNQSYRNMIPKYIEAGVDWTEGGSKIGDKIGQIDQSRSDVAAIWTDNGLIVISAYTFDNKDTRWNAENEAELLIAKMAKVVYDEWAKPRKQAARVK